MIHKILHNYFIQISIGTYIVSLLIVAFDSSLKFQWIAFGFHILSLLLVLFVYYYSFLKSKIIFSGKELLPLCLIIPITITANFLFLQIYPYISIADELRDGGLNVVQILTGKLNIFAYGSYNAHGLIIPALITPFYYLFGNSILLYRFPAALLSTVDVVLLYLLIRIVLTRTVAFWSALILATLPLHMFFAHTQIVIAFTFFWVPIILLALFIVLQKHRVNDYILFGILMGFACEFHATIRAFCMLVFLIFLFLEMKKFTVKHDFLKGSKNLILVILFFFVGFGPQLFFTTPQIFFHTSRFAYENTIENSRPLTLQDIVAIKDNYVKSLMMYTSEPIAFYYPDEKPLFTPLLALFFLLGMGYALFVLRNTFLNVLFAIVIILPFFTSAITDSVNADYRASPLFAVASIFAALGVSYLLSLVKWKPGKIILSLGLLFYLSMQVVMFYTLDPANKLTTLRGFLITHTDYFLHDTYYAKLSSRNIPTKLCIAASPYNYSFYQNNYALKEQQQFLLPGIMFYYMENNTIKNNEVYIMKNDCSNVDLFVSSTSLQTISCLHTNNFVCPPDYTGTMLLHY